MVGDRGLRQDGRVPSEPGSREPDLASRSGPTGFDPSRGEALEDALRSLASYVGAGGYNAAIVDPSSFEDKIRWGIDHLVNAAIQRCADIVEEQSKDYARSTYGSIKRAILDLKTDRDSDGSPEGEDALAASSETTARAEGIAQTDAALSKVQPL